MAGGDPGESRRGRRWLAGALVFVVLAFCVLVVLKRDAVRSRYWAYCLRHADSDSSWQLYASALCNAGAGARWGISVLLEDEASAHRKIGVLALANIDAPWAREALIERLRDPDGEVRMLASVTLGRGDGDLALIERLGDAVRAGSAAAAQAAGLTLARLGTPEALGELRVLAQASLPAGKRAGLIDALELLRQPGCVEPLLGMLGDARPCGQARYADGVTRDALAGAVVEGAAGGSEPPRARPVDEPVGLRAAAALNRISGLAVAYSPEMAPVERAAARRVWQQWAEEARE